MRNIIIIVTGFLLLGIFAGPSPVDAVIVYSGIRDVLMPHFPNDAEIDRTEMEMAGAEAALSVLNNSSGDEVFRLSGQLGVYATVFTDGPFVDSFGFGQVIGNELEWLGFRPVTLVDYTEDTESFRGHFFNQKNLYAAVQTTVEENVFYGWLRLSHSAEDEILTVHDWAWNSVPGEPILAGEIPEPKVYALLLGIGVLLWAAECRRRRSVVYGK